MPCTTEPSRCWRPSDGVTERQVKSLTWSNCALHFAICDLMGTQHATEWKNVRFYWNPVTSLLEPIGFDGNGWLPVEDLCYRLRDRRDKGFWREFSAGDFYAQLFRDPAFLEKYVQKLDYVSTAGYLEGLLDEAREGLERNIHIIHMEDPEFQYSADVLFQNRKYIRSVLEPVRAAIAYYENSTPEGLQVQVGNPHYLPTVVVGASCGEFVLDAESEVTLPGKTELAVIDFQRLTLRVPPDFTWKDEMYPQLKIRYKTLGMDTIREASVTPWPYLDPAVIAKDPTKAAPNSHEFEFVVTNEASHEISLMPGSWTIDSDLVFPAGYIVRCNGNTTLNLTSSAAIISNSPLQFIGHDESPIVIESTDGTGQGMLVLDADGDSELSDVIFRNLTAPSRPGWALTGAVTFYESPVTFTRCHFMTNHCEDALNLIRTSFLLSESHFTETQGDAFDADFCDGKVVGSRFVRCGNDAIDVSGSTITVERVTVEQAGDKGVSIGEDSTATITDLSVQNGRIGIAVKDLSHLTARRISLNNCQYGMALFQKKPEYGPVVGDVRFIDFNEVQIPYLIETGSTLTVDGDVINPNREHLKHELYEE